MLMTDRQFNRSCIIRLRSSFLINLSFEKERSPAGYSLSPSLTETFLLQFQRLETLIPDCHSLSWHMIIDIDGTDVLQMTLTYSISGVHILKLVLVGQDLEDRTLQAFHMYSVICSTFKWTIKNVNLLLISS